MSVVLELPAELETELAAEATRLRLPLAEYAVRILASGRRSGPKPNNGAELLAYWQSAGLIGTRTDIADTQGHARNEAEKRAADGEARIKQLEEQMRRATGLKDRNGTSH